MMQAICRWAGVSLVVLCVCGVVAPVASAGEGNPFGIEKFTIETTMTKEVREEGGPVVIRRFENVPYAASQAGGHPWGLTTTVEFAHEIVRNELEPTRDAKDVVVDLPPGLLGNPDAVPKCPLTQLLTTGVNCPAATQIGEAVLHVYGGSKELVGPIVNVTPEVGQSAEFAIENSTHLDPLLTGHLVHTAQGYGFAVTSNEIPIADLRGFELTFWGVPADPSHNPQRGLLCQDNTDPESCDAGLGGESSGVPAVPFLTLPTDCSAGPETARMRADSWEEPGHVSVGGEYEGYLEKQAEVALPPGGVTGCNLLRFEPSIEALPDTLLADEPVGVGVNLAVPLNEQPEGLATPQLRDSYVTLPEGLSVSPGVVDGIQACNEFGPEGIDITGPESEEVGLDGEWQLAPGHCPDASTIGEAEAFTPLLPVPVKGHVYLARPDCGGPGQGACTEADAEGGRLYRLYLELGGTGELADTGVHIKVPLETEANPVTGQLTTRTLGVPQAPFGELKIRLNGGPRAPLANPATCGTATTTADFTPWSAPGTTPEGLLVSGTPDATPFKAFDVAGCASPPGLKPGFVAGTVTPQAGRYSAFTLNLSREDREQYVKGIQVHTPPGLLGMLSTVPLCQEPQADAGTCGEASQIGTTRVATGAGSHPFEIEGNVYLTGPYEGSPFGLSIVVHVVAGPFNLGDVVVRARIAVDPVNSALTITTDETGPYAIPQIVFGVPVRLKRITVNINRPDFMFNPTNCGIPGQPGSQQVTAKVSGSENAVTEVKSQFAVGGCKSLEFKPKFVVTTSGKTSKAGGASLDAKVSYPDGSVGNEANIASVKVELPKQLPSRLTTLQKACTAAQFEANPSGCPAASIVGTVRASTPLLPVALQGPVYFVSHGGEAFPSLIVVLQGDGVRVDLTGSTFISKTGITSSTFKTVPDVPVNTFELYLPEGPYSALAANGNLCDLTTTIATRRKVAKKEHAKTVHRTVTTRTTKPATLTMPTEFVAQNGAVLKQNTTVTVSGCTTTKTKTKTKPKQKAAKRGNANSKGRTR
jgi:hypothetical protein